MALGMVDAERKRRQNVAGAEVLEIDGLVLAFSNLPDPQLNSVVVHHDPTDALAAMEAAEREFVQRSHPIGIDLQVGRNPGVDEAVRSMGLIRIIERPGMALDVDAVPEAPVPHGIEIRPVTSDEDVRGLVEVGVQAFGDDPEIGMSCYGVSSRGVDGAEAFIAWRGEEPVGYRDRLPARGRRGGHGGRGGSRRSDARARVGADGSGGARVPRRRSRVAPSQRRGALDVRAARGSCPLPTTRSGYAGPPRQRRRRWRDRPAGGRA